MVTIRVNGEAMTLDAPTTVEGLLGLLRIDPRRVAVEHNGAIVNRERYGSVPVEAGDEIEIVNFVGGGGGERGLEVSFDDRRDHVQYAAAKCPWEHAPSCQTRSSSPAAPSPPGSSSAPASTRRMR